MCQAHCILLIHYPLESKLKKKIKFSSVFALNKQTMEPYALNPLHGPLSSYRTSS